MSETASSSSAGATAGRDGSQKGWNTIIITTRDDDARKINAKRSTSSYNSPWKLMLTLNPLYHSLIVLSSYLVWVFKNSISSLDNLSLLPKQPIFLSLLCLLFYVSRITKLSLWTKKQIKCAKIINTVGKASILAYTHTKKFMFWFKVCIFVEWVYTKSLGLWFQARAQKSVNAIIISLLSVYDSGFRV